MNLFKVTTLNGLLQLIISIQVGKPDTTENLHPKRKIEVSLLALFPNCIAQVTTNPMNLVRDLNSIEQLIRESYRLDLNTPIILTSMNPHSLNGKLFGKARSWKIFQYWREYN